MDETKSKPQGDALVSALLTNENLQYAKKVSTSIIIEKGSKEFFADKSSYTEASDRIVFTLNSGSDFINGANSYLKFDLKITGTGDGSTEAKTSTFGVGSAANLFSEIIIRSRDGVEVERIRNINSLVATKLRWMYSQDYVDKVCTMAGVGAWDEIQPVGLSPEGAGVASYVVPLKWLSGLFSCDSLLPSFLMSGARLEFVLATVGNAFKKDAASTATGYTVSNPIIRLETCRLSDAIMQALTTRAANGGLRLNVSTWDLTQATTSGSTQNVEVRRNISQCLGVVVKNRLTANLDDTETDSMASEATHSVTSYRFRLGSQFIPSAAVSGAAEAYALSQIAFNKFKASNAENAVSYNQFATGGYSVISSDLERSAVDLSGSAISNSRLLAYEANTTSAARTCDVFVNFTRFVDCYLSNTLVSD